MQELQSLAASPAFWLSSVLLAFLMSFFASYAKDWLDRLLVRRTARRDAEVRAAQVKFEERVQKLIANPHLLGLYQTNIVYQKLRQVLYLVVQYVAMLLAVNALLTFSLALFSAMLTISVIFEVLRARLVDKRLRELRATVNAVLSDDEQHFVG